MSYWIHKLIAIFNVNNTLKRLNQCPAKLKIKQYLFDAGIVIQIKDKSRVFNFGREKLF